MSYKRKENHAASMLGIAVSFGIAGVLIIIKLASCLN
jgi:hypothetical protein